MKKFLFVFLLVGIWLFSIRGASAQETISLTTTINPGALTASIRDPSGQFIDNFSYDFGRIANSFDCRYDASALSGFIGDSQLFYIENPRATFDGWTLGIAPADGQAANWLGDSGHQFDFNDPGSDNNGCDDTDQDGSGGNLALDLSQARMGTDCLECTTSNVYFGSTGQEFFSDNSSITLLQANKAANNLGRWFVSGIDLRQTVPPAQDGDAYTLELVLTAAAS